MKRGSFKTACLLAVVAGASGAGIGCAHSPDRSSEHWLNREATLEDRPADPTLNPLTSPVASDDGPGHAGQPGRSADTARGARVPVAVDAAASPTQIVVKPGEPVAREIEVQAEIPDSGIEVADVRLRFRNAPIEVPLSRESNTQWRGYVSERQLRLLAIEGRSTQYVGDIVATNSSGRASVGRKPIAIEVTAPSG